ncbi:hypothetical protein [Aminivibrio sp.]|uniref:hypothetical protein n=1 Tax=Aminivibrio sp. TaxID=1872489 RepID=UPI001A5D20B5|nr:hypothetical protein [Aminivibrio sp.]MBL3539601.1 hypothetical protein [Aminivibrio sp.]MDK2958469.1 hypothetical protein [Synergistaceae bacterium]
MLSIVRGGPRILLLSGNVAAMKSLVSSKFRCTEHTLEGAFDSAGEGQSVILFRERPLGGRRFFMADAAADEILALFLNSGGEALPASVRIMPRLLFFRVFGEKERVIGQIARDYSAERGRLRSVLRVPKKGAIAVCFTAKPLNRPLSLADMMDEVLHVEGVSFEKLLNSLRSRALWYFSEGLENRQWNELEIRIYDSWGRYLDHYERLRIVLESLEAGMILGEGWGKDYAHILMAVKIYRVRLFTFLPAPVIKEILMGLEYGADGSRLVDFDLYSGKEKISWGGIGGKAKSRGERNSMGADLRAQLFSQLFPEDREHLEEWERRVLRQRTGEGNREN